MSATRTATLITSHVWNSDRRAGFHWIADGLMRRGWQVNFVTGYSWLDFAKGGYRRRFVKFSDRNRALAIDGQMTTLVNSPFLRPIDFRHEKLNSITTWVFRGFRNASCNALRRMVSNSDLVVMESTYEIMFTPHLRALAKKPRFVYRVSDDMGVRKTHPIAIEDELRALDMFDLVSLPNANMCERFPHKEHIIEQKHGIPTHLFDCEASSPFEEGTKNAVFTGNNFLDEAAIKALASAFPDFCFHIIGPFAQSYGAKNVKFYGELPYHETIPFVQNANIGLNTLSIPGFEESNKMQQYRYCSLPVIVNSTSQCFDRDRFFYESGNTKSLTDAFKAATNYVPSPALRDQVRSWDDLVSELIAEH